MKIVFVGAGNLATNLCLALNSAGHEVVQVYSRTMDSAHALAQRVGAQATNDVAELATNADIYIIGVTDSALKEVSSLVVSHIETERGTGRMPLIVHTAGSIPMDVIGTDRCGVLYPMQTFSRNRIVEFSNIPIFIEANHEADLNVLQGLSASISTSVRVLSSDDRRYLHLAAVFCSNFVNHCYTLTAEILERKGIDFSAMLPLIDEVAAKVHELAPKDAQTGPARRCDTNVMQAQADLLSYDPRIQEIYRIMSKSIMHD